MLHHLVLAALSLRISTSGSLSSVTLVDTDPSCTALMISFDDGIIINCYTDSYSYTINIKNIVSAIYVEGIFFLFFNLENLRTEKLVNRGYLIS